MREETIVIMAIQNITEFLRMQKEIFYVQQRQQMQAVHMVGMPEARIILSEAAIYVATSKKSNASYLAINKALEDVANKDTGEVPIHIRNAPVEGMEKEGYHVGYKYPHDYPGHYVEQQYLPDKVKNKKYYYPKRSKYEDSLNLGNQAMKKETN